MLARLTLAAQIWMPPDDDDDDVTEIEDGWARLKMTSPGEVQGVRFLSGAIIDAKPEDAEKLIRSGKAVRVDENGNIIEFLEDDFDNQDASKLCRRGRRSCRR